jgi:hypothetical protein
MPADSNQQHRWYVPAGYIILLAAVWFLWNTLALYPFRLLVVFFHELSHGLAAVLTGGSILRIELGPAEGGLCVTAGGHRFVVISAGYLGSLLWGGLLLQLARQQTAVRVVTAGLGIVLLATAVLYIRPVTAFGFAYGLLTGVACIAASVWLWPTAQAWLLRAVGVVSCLYAVFDIRADVFNGSGRVSDAHILAEHTGIPAWMWGALWIGIAVPVTAGLLWRAARPTRARKG